VTVGRKRRAFSLTITRAGARAQLKMQAAAAAGAKILFPSKEACEQSAVHTAR